MKKGFVFWMALAVAFFVAMPAMAMKLETKGYMDVAGILVKNYVVDAGTAPDQKRDATSAWYQQEMIIEPVLWVNDWVRIHNKITIMERYWNGGSGAEYDTNNFGQIAFRGGNYRSEHNFWWEQMYLSFPLYGGHLYVGRQPGGAWAYPFQDSSSNRDRIKWVGKVMGKYTVAALIEKLREGDSNLPQVSGGVGPWLANTAAYTNSASDQDAYALGFVIPITKEFSWIPLFYYINEQNTITATFPAAQGGQFLDYLFFWSNGFKYKSGPFKLDAEVNYWKSPLQLTATTEQKRDQIAGWLDFAYTTGPYEIGLGGFYLQGTARKAATDKRHDVATTGEDFEPYFLTFSEDVGCLWNTTGVQSDNFGSGSGYISVYLRGGYKISDAMVLTAKAGYLRAAKMDVIGTVAPSKKLGWEFDLGYEFKFMKNIKYVVDAGIFFPGKYFDNMDGNPTQDLTNNVYGARHMLVIEW